MKPKTKQKFKYILAALFVAASAFRSSSALAATIALRTSTVQVNSGATFTLSVDADTQGATINNAEAVISFPADLLQVDSVNTGGSIFSIWPEPAAFSNTNGTVTFDGGVPNPGYNGSGGHILSVQFKAKASGVAQLSFVSAKIRENDGLGTNVLSGKTGTSISVVQQASQPPLPVASNNAPSANSGQAIELVITSPTDPDSSKWYSNSGATFLWKLPAGAIAIQTALDRSQGAVPQVLRTPPVSTISVHKIDDGVWYFNARVKTSAGWSQISSYKIQIDTVAPDSVTINNGSSSASPTLSAHDALSGIDYFMVQVDGAPAVKIASAGSETPIAISGISPGTHKVLATAYDLAGNSAAATSSVEFPQPQNVEITNYSKIIREGGRITANGTGPQNSVIQIELVTQDGIARMYNTASNESGAFSFQSEPIAGAGSYQLWAQSVLTDGSLGAASAHAQILVNPSAITQLAAFFKSLFTATNIIIFALSVLCILGWMNYFLLKKSSKRPVSRRSVKKI